MSLKLYDFTINVVGEGFIFADSFENAKQKVQNNKWEEFSDIELRGDEIERYEQMDCKNITIINVKESDRKF
jgi:hypothetical protein